MSINTYIQAARLRTLPLAIAGIISGNLLAAIHANSMHWKPFILSLSTAILLQILSNYANDYGDFKNGADTAIRTDRVMASGKMSLKQMQIAILTLILLSLISGLGLLFLSIQVISMPFWILLCLGILGIAAAYFYTAGKKPYGYFGLGDFSVYLFFGMLAVLGAYYLQAGTLPYQMTLIAHALACMSVAVLNINNIRDIETDAQKNKHTIATQLGYKRALTYHKILLTNAWTALLLFIYVTKAFNSLSIIYIVVIGFILYKQWLKLKACSSRMAYNSCLKSMSTSTLMIMCGFCLCYFISKI